MGACVLLLLLLRSRSLINLLVVNSDVQQSYAAGYLEGALTAPRCYQHYTNSSLLRGVGYPMWSRPHPMWRATSALMAPLQLWQRDGDARRHIGLVSGAGRLDAGAD